MNQGPKPSTSTIDGSDQSDDVNARWRLDAIVSGAANIEEK